MEHTALLSGSELSPSPPSDNIRESYGETNRESTLSLPPFHRWPTVVLLRDRGGGREVEREGEGGREGERDAYLGCIYMYVNRYSTLVGPSGSKVCQVNTLLNAAMTRNTS